MISGKELGDSWQCVTAVILTHIWTNNLHVVVVVLLLLLVWICLFSGWRENEDQEAEFTTRARGSAIRAPLCQKYHWRVQKGKTLQAYPFYVVGVFSPSNSSDQKSSSGFFSTHLSSSLSVVASFFLNLLVVTVPWLSGTPQWTTGDVWAQSGKDGSDICRHQCLHAAHDVPGNGCLSLHAGLGRSHELWREDCTAIQVNRSAVIVVTCNMISGVFNESKPRPQTVIGNDFTFISFLLFKCLFCFNFRRWHSNNLSLQCSLPSLLPKRSIHVSKTGTAVFGTGEEDARSQSSEKGLLIC